MCCIRTWLLVDRTTASMGWGRYSPTRCKYILVRSPPASEASRRSTTTSPNPCPSGVTLRQAPGRTAEHPTRPKGWAQEHEAGRGFGGRLEAWMPEASLQGSTCGVPPNPLPASCPALPLKLCTPHITQRLPLSSQYNPSEPGVTSGNHAGSKPCRVMVRVPFGSSSGMTLSSRISPSACTRDRPKPA